MHKFLVCSYNSQYFAQTPENFARSHNRETVTFITLGFGGSQQQIDNPIRLNFQIRSLQYIITLYYQIRLKVQIIILDQIFYQIITLNYIKLFLHQELTNNMLSLAITGCWAALGTGVDCIFTLELTAVVRLTTRAGQAIKSDYIRLYYYIILDQVRIFLCQELTSAVRQTTIAGQTIKLDQIRFVWIILDWINLLPGVDSSGTVDHNVCQTNRLDYGILDQFRSLS